MTRRSPQRMHPDPGPPPPAAAAADYLGTAWLALRRHARLAAACLAAALAATAVALVVAPRTWQARAVVLIGRNAQAQALGTPDRTFPREEEPPTRGAADLALERAGLEALADELLALSPPKPGWRRRLGLGKPPDAERQREATVETLLARVSAKVEASQGTLTLEVGWGDPAAARLIVDRLSRRFVERRRQLEVEALAKTLAVLEEHATGARAEVAKALGDATAQQARSNASIETTAQTVGDSPATARERERAHTLQTLVEARAMVSGLEDGWRKRRLELKAALDELSQRYTPANPAVRLARERIAVAERTPPEVVQARKEAARLLERYLAQGGSAADLQDGGASHRGAARAAVSGSLLERDPGVAHARRSLEVAEAHQAALASRLESARIEYQTAKEAFGGRYVLLQPAAVSAKATPTKSAIVGGGLAGGIALALIAVLLAHLEQGRILRTWQLERQLGLRVLGELRPARAGDGR